MERKSLWRWNLLIIFSLALVGCASQMELQPDQTYFALKPTEALEESELATIPENLFVKVENVADMGTSYKNRLELYINGRLIKPEKEISNYQNTYTYRLKLQPGIYKIKALYLAYDGWKEKAYQIIPRETVKIKPNTKTILSAYIWKKWNGLPTQKVMLFEVKYEPLLGTSSSTMATKNKKTQVGQHEPPPTTDKRELDDLIILQINTAPANANVIVDDKYMGQSPLKVYIDRNNSHIVQISYPGYKEVMKFLDSHQFGNKKVIHLMQKLEPKPVVQ